MSRSSVNLKRIRKDYSKIQTTLESPNLVEMQKLSYADFLQMDVTPNQRKNKGLHAIFNFTFPITSNSGKYTIEYKSYSFDPPKYSSEECKKRGTSYASLLKVKFHLVSYDIDPDTETKKVKDIKEQDIYLGDIPLMTENGSFVINGSERVVVSQIHRAQGVFFDYDKSKSRDENPSYGAYIVPERGVWLDIEFDQKDMLYFRIDKRKKFPLTTLLRCFDNAKTAELRKKAESRGKILDASLVEGPSNREILELFYDFDTCEKHAEGWKIKYNPELFKSSTLDYDVKDAKTLEIVIKKGTKVSTGVIKKLERLNLEDVVVQDEYLLGGFLGQDLTDQETGEVFAKTGTSIDESLLEYIVDNNINAIDYVVTNGNATGPYVIYTLMADKNETKEAALNEIYKLIRNADAPNLYVAEYVFESLFFKSERYDLSEVGRVRINDRFGFDDVPSDLTVLRKEDILAIIKYLLGLKDGKHKVEDVDHLGNRRVRSVGELVENQIRSGITKAERSIQEKINAANDDVMLNELMTVKPLQNIIKEFFGTSQLSQFMDQTNPLSEITHKRRLSALGPRGLTRDRATFEIRDVHTTHYGRICPIETPEGPNIGLINALATYARVSKYGFLETPYRKVENGKILDQIKYMNASQEIGHIIAQANTKINDNDEIIDEIVSCRQDGENVLVSPQEVDYIDISPQQVVSVAAALVPFLENNDANRALMGANMQRQAVPLMISEAPIVGTGMEAIVARDSGACILAKSDGIVESVDSQRIVISSLNDTLEGEDDVEIYKLKKFERSNNNTCINQQAIVSVGDKVSKGEVIADGPSTDLGDLSLGKNVLVAFVPWNGYNFEDSILISERIVRDEVFTSIHIEQFEVVARDTKLGPEEITSDIPNVSESALAKLDESGVVHTGAVVKQGDILVGKVTPKAESVITPEERLLKAIFGKKANDVKDSSLRVPAGVQGTVIGVNMYSRRGIEKDSRAHVLEKKYIDSLTKERDAELKVVRKSYVKKMARILCQDNTSLNYEELQALKVEELLTKASGSNAPKLNRLKEELDLKVAAAEQKLHAQLENLQKGDDLPSGVLKVVKVFVAVKRKLKSGDKMAGRHGNKGVVSRILPIEDMPYLEDGTPVDVCLNPLGVPSRMNIGQILETHMGWASANIGKQINSMVNSYMHGDETLDNIKQRLQDVYGSKYTKIIEELETKELIRLARNLKKGVPVNTSVFDGVKLQDIDKMLEMAGVDQSGQQHLIDGRTGEYFDRKVTVGYLYMLKLHHLVDEKIHARSVGPYSLITQQPLGGKAQFGGQRFGEMEVWALNAYGAAHILREMLTVKSDDQTGRVKVFESIIKGEETFETGLPESFNVLVKELRSLCIDIETKKKH